MAELSQFLPGGSGINYLTDYFNAATLTETYTNRTSAGNLVNVTGKGIVTLYTNDNNNSATVTLTIDGEVWPTLEVESLSRALGSRDPSGSNTIGRVSLPYETSIVVDVVAPGTGTGTATVFALIMNS